jgi:hypothetical protein
MDDFRNTDNAWMVTKAIHYHDADKLLINLKPGEGELIHNLSHSC